MKKESTKESLKKHNLAPHKKFGQNFLVNPHTVNSIIDCGKIEPHDTLIEVGVGLGALTIPLARRADKVIGVEIDRGIIRYHHQEKDLPENVELIHGDILKTDFNELKTKSGHNLKIMANLPYSISNPFIFKLIENQEIIDWVVVMLQKEVGDRLSASPSTKEYGIPTILLQTYAKVEKKIVVKPHEFHPQPKVDSVVLFLDFSDIPAEIQSLPAFDRTLFQKVVRSSFAQRRKTLVNNLLSSNIFDRTVWERDIAKQNILKVFDSLEFSASVRAEALTLKEFANLTRLLKPILSKHQK